MGIIGELYEQAGEALRAIEREQEKLSETDTAFTVGEQLKDICLQEPRCALLLAEDFARDGQRLKEAAAMLQKYANKHRAGATSFCIPPKKAEELLREFFGLPAAEKAEKAENPRRLGKPEEEASGIVSLMDLI